MTPYNTLDQQGRFIDYHIQGYDKGQHNNITYSYLEARDIYENLGQVMGFDMEKKE